MKKAIALVSLLTLTVLAQEVVTTTNTQTGVNTQVPVWLLGAVAVAYNFIMSAVQKFVYSMSPGVMQSLLKKLVDLVSANQEHKK